MRAGPLVAITAILAIAACAPGSGEIVDKAFSPPHSVWIAGSNSRSCASYRKSRCSMYINTYESGHWQYYPARWSMKISNGEDSGWRNVGSGLWDSCTVGQWYENNRCGDER